MTRFLLAALFALCALSANAGTPDPYVQVTVPNTAALMTYPASAAHNGTIIRLTDGVAGAPSLPYQSSGAPCTLNAGAGDGGGEVPTRDGLCWNAIFPSGPLDVRQWGAPHDGVTDAIVPITAALAYGVAHNQPIYFPVPGSTGYKISSPLVLQSYGAIEGDVLTHPRIDTGVTTFVTTDTDCIHILAVSSTVTNITCAGNGATSTSATVTVGIVAFAGAYESTLNHVRVRGYVHGFHLIDRMKVLDIGQDDFSAWPNLTNGFPTACVYNDGGGQVAEAISGDFSLSCRTQSQSINSILIGNGVQNWQDLTLTATSAFGSSQAARLWSARGIQICQPIVPGTAVYPCNEMVAGTDYTLWDCGAAPCAGSGGTELFVKTVTATVTDGSTTITVPDTTGWPSGADILIYAEHNLEMPAHVVSIDSGTTLTSSVAPLTFSGKMKITFAKAGIGSQSCALGLTPTCAHYLEVRYTTAPKTNIRTLMDWIDPWAYYGIYEKRGGENTYNVGFMGGYFSMFSHHTSYGNDTVNVGYEELNYYCMVVDDGADFGFLNATTGDTVTTGRNVRPPAGSSGRCPKYIAPTAPGNRLIFNGSDWTVYYGGNVFSNLGILQIGSAAKPLSSIASTIELDISQMSCGQASAVTLTATEDGSTYLAGTNYHYHLATPVASSSSYAATSSGGDSSFPLTSGSIGTTGAYHGHLYLTNFGVAADHIIDIVGGLSTSAGAYQGLGFGAEIVGTPAPIVGIQIACGAAGSTLTGKFRIRDMP